MNNRSFHQRAGRPCAETVAFASLAVAGVVTILSAVSSMSGFVAGQDQVAATLTRNPPAIATSAVTNSSKPEARSFDRETSATALKVRWGMQSSSRVIDF